MQDLTAPVPFMGSMAQSETLRMAAIAKRLKAEGKDVCSMTAGEPDFDTPEPIKQAAIQALAQGRTKYTPATGELALRKAIAEKLSKENGVPSDAERVVVAPGAKFSVFSAIAAVCGPGDEVVLPAPYWVSYPEMIKGVGAAPVVLPTAAADNFEPAPSALEAAITPRTRMLILNSPSNPTGAVYRLATLKAIAEIAVRRNIMVLSDEIYEKLVYDADFPHVSIASLGAEIAERTITVNGFSKAYSMTGWRLGYLTGPKWAVDRVGALQSHTTSNPVTFAQDAALHALVHCSKEVEEMRQAFARRRDLICSLLSEIKGLSALRPQGAFYVFCDISSFGLRSGEFCERLLSERMVAAVPGAPFGADGSIRLSYACSDESIRKACARIGEFCASLR